MKIAESYVAKILGLVLIVIVWHVFYSLDVFESAFFPSPTSTFSSIIRLFTQRNLLTDITVTLLRVLMGFMLAVVIGITIGLIIGSSKLLSITFEGIIDFFRSIPVVTLYPVFMLFFGFTNNTKIAMVFWATFWVVTLNTAFGVKQSKKIRSEVATVYKTSKFQRFKWITFYEALPNIVVGIRVAISFALLAGIMSEMFMGSNYGIGQRIFEANVRFSATDLYALVLVTGTLGILLNKIFILLEKKIIPWVDK